MQTRTEMIMDHRFLVRFRYGTSDGAFELRSGTEEAISNFALIFDSDSNCVQGLEDEIEEYFSGFCNFK